MTEFKSKEFAERHHALWRELLQCEPTSADDESALSGYLNWMAGIENETDWSKDRFIDITNFLEKRAVMMSKLRDDQRAGIEAYRRERAKLRARDAWQRAAPRPVSDEEYRRMVAEASDVDPVPVMGVSRSADFIACKDALRRPEAQE